jgi:hypothetical protein
MIEILSYEIVAFLETPNNGFTVKHSDGGWVTENLIFDNWHLILLVSHCSSAFLLCVLLRPIVQATERSMHTSTVVMAPALVLLLLLALALSPTATAAPPASAPPSLQTDSAGGETAAQTAAAIPPSTTGGGGGGGAATDTHREAGAEAEAAPPAPLLPNWSVFEESAELPDVQESLRVVQSIPVQHFWDFHKGHFKFGILGESVAELYPHLVTQSKRKFSIDSPTYDVTSANTDVIFTHLVVVVQHLAVKMASVVGSTVEELLAEGDNVALKIIRIANETGIEWRTANEIRTSREVLEIKKQIVKAEMLRAVTRNDYRNATFHHYSAEKLQLLLTQHEHLLAAISASHARQDAVEAAKQQDLLRLSSATETQRRATQGAVLQHAHTAAVERLRVQVQLGVRAVVFRASEEGRVERQNEDVALSVMRARGESMRKGFEEVARLLQVKASMLGRAAAENPWGVLRGVLAVAGALSLYIVLVEMAQVGECYLYLSLVLVA